MLLALASSVVGKVRPIQEKGSRGRKSDSLLRSALRAFGVKESAQPNDDILASFSTGFLPTWGVEMPCSLLLSGLSVSEVCDKVNRSEIVMPTCNSSVTKVSVDCSWQRLKSVAISELKLFCPTKGSCLECEVVGDPRFVVGITTVIQDVRGNAVLCGIYNLPGVCDQRSASSKLQRGSTLLIAEPFLKVMSDGCRGIRVDNPSEIQVFPPGHKPQRGEAEITAGQFGKRPEAKERAERQPAVNLSELLEGSLDPGTRVRLKGLTSKKGLAMNGKCGRVAQQDAQDLERITVEVESATGTAEVIKVRPNNVEVAACEMLPDILQVKDTANQSFSQGNLQAAIDGYSEVLGKLSCLQSDEATAEMAKCFCNRALCFQKQGKWDTAAADAQLAIDKAPTYVKGHARLAATLLHNSDDLSQDDVRRACLHICIAIALAGRSAGEDLLTQLRSIATASEDPVPNAQELVSVRCYSELAAALASSSIKFVVLRPGEYHWPSEFGQANVLHDVTMVGLAATTLIKGNSHLVRICAGRMCVRNVCIKDSKAASFEGGASFCVDGPRSRLTLSGCKIEDSSEVGILVAEGGRAIVKDCHFSNILRQAIEVRAAGELEVQDSTFRRVRQGVSAYGGARSVVLRDVIVDMSFDEGVLACGDQQNAETRQQARYCAEDPRARGTGERKEAIRRGRKISEQARAVAEELDWNGRLTLTMSDCTVRQGQGLGCSIDEGCAAFLHRCTFEHMRPNMTTNFPGIGVLIKGESDCRVSCCRFLNNMAGVSVGFNYAGSVLVESSVFAGNQLKDVQEDANAADSLLLKLPPKLANHPAFKELNSQRKQLEEVGAWSAPVKQIGNKFFSRKEKVPEVAELTAAAGEGPLPQKLAWEAASQQRHSLSNPCGCGFACTELANSQDCSQPALRNHVDFPPFPCLPASEHLAKKQDDANKQFYFRQGRPFRHWSLLGEVLSVGTAQGADAASFMVRAADAAKLVKMRSKFAAQPMEADVEVLLMLEEALANGSARVAAGSTVAILYAEMQDIDITSGRGSVQVQDCSRVFAFAGSLQDVLEHAEACSQSPDDIQCCAVCRKEGIAIRRCELCNAISYCSECRGQHTAHAPLCSQMEMLRLLSGANFRSFSEPFSFVEWAEQAAEQSRARRSEFESREKPAEPTEQAATVAKTADEICKLLDGSTATELQAAIAAAEEALREKLPDGSFRISKNQGRARLQNRLKRAKAKLSEEPVAKLDAQSAQPEVQYEPETSPAGPAGCGPLDTDGYHGVWELPRWECPRKCCKDAHIFVSYPRGRAPNKEWCIQVRPQKYCTDFKIIHQLPEHSISFLSCWGHASNRPGWRLPDSGRRCRLWRIRPSDVTFSQDSISKSFTDGKTLDGTLESLRSGKCKLEDIEQIKITWHSHWRVSAKPRWWTYTGNRRLSLYQQLEKEGFLEYIVAEWVNLPVPEWRVTTEAAGQIPRRRK
ncbi:unnamed protein product [Effrenium voratum]|nr:unnamed protein product [Effrenium voratum]CAJ1444880.1 unnamed protein product [Effrenium voratum]